MRRWLAWGIAGVVAAGALACGSDDLGPTTEEYAAERARLEAQARRAAADRSGEVEEEAGLGSIEEGYVYDPTGKRDPFRSFVLELKKVDSEAERGPLEQFDLNQLSLVGVVWSGSRPRAVIEDPSGHGYIVGKGTRIGKNKGEIVDIGDSVVLVKEVYVDYLGARTAKEIEMRIRHEQGG